MEDWVNRKFKRCTADFVVRVNLWSRIPKHTRVLIKEFAKSLRGVRLANGNIKVKSVKLDYLEEPIDYGDKK
jgi:hypothetical protein